MNLSEVTSVPLASLPLQEFRDHLRLGSGFEDDSIQDPVLESALLAAINAIEDRTGKALLTRQFRMVINAWETPNFQSISRGPIQNVLSVTLLRSDGSRIEVSSENYLVFDDLFRPSLRAVGVFPQIPQNGRAEIDFEAGYGTTWDAVPDSLAQAVFLLAAHFYEGRGGLGTMSFPALVRSLISSFREVRLFGGRRK